MSRENLDTLVAAANAYARTTQNCSDVVMTDQDFGPGDADAFCELQEVSAEARTHFESLTPQYETQGDCDKYQEAEQTARAAEAMRDLFLMGRVLKRQMGD